MSDLYLAHSPSLIRLTLVLSHKILVGILQFDDLNEQSRMYRVDKSVQYTTIAGWSLSIAVTLDALDFDAEKIFSKAGLCLSDIQAHPDYLIDIRAMTRLWQEVECVTNIAHFGLLVGQHSNIKKTDIFTQLIKNATSILHIFEGLPSYYGKMSNSVCLTLNNTPQLLGVTITPLEGVEISDLAIDAFFSSFFCIIRDFGTNGQFVDHVDLVRSKPNIARCWQDYFGCDVVFSQESNCLWLKKSTLTRLTMQSLLFKFGIQLKKGVDRMSLTEKIERLIHSSIATSEPTLDEIALMLNMSVRSISRTLKEEGASFRDILKFKRQELAVHYLINTDDSILIISENLSYKNMGNFTRAFQSWFDQTPSQYRELHKEK